jgi:hypothetical protein
MWAVVTVVETADLMAEKTAASLAA